MIKLDKKVPKVYANKIEGKAGNNEDVYYSHGENLDNEDRTSSTMPKLKGKNVNQKLNEIFNSANYVYKADVKLTLKDGIVTKRIVGRNSTHLITIDNELIPITDILDIEKS